MSFPLIKDIDGVLAGPCESTHGGIMTIKPPGYVLAVTNPSDSGDTPPADVISAKGTTPEVQSDSTTIVFTGGIQLIPGPQGPTGPPGFSAMPSPIVLTGPTVSVDASTPPGTVYLAPIYFRITLTSNITIQNPVNMADSQRVIFELIQDSVGGHTVTWGSAFKFGTDVPFALQTAGANKRDFVAWVYSNGVWDCVGVTRGY